MNSFIKTVDVRWADLDPNLHLRHSVYYDYGAASRIDFFQQHGITTEFMQKHSFGPILFREECVFKKEIKQADLVTIDLKLQKARPDCSRWTIRHVIYKNGDIICAILTLDAAWIDVLKRKLRVPPPEVLETFGMMPKDADFEWVK